MNTLTEDLDRLHHRILAADAESRRKFLPRLTQMIGRMDAAGTHVPARVRNLHEELTADAIEAQFDNMPV